MPMMPPTHSNPRAILRPLVCLAHGGVCLAALDAPLRLRHSDASSGFALQVVLLRDVEAGESLSISYAPIESSTRHRRRA